MMEVTTSPRLPDEAGGHGPWSRVIVHFDLDCFYAQVEHNRLEIPFEVPLVVVQWGSSIAVNYAVRKFGVKRGMSEKDVRALCQPNPVHCVPVELIGDGELAPVLAGAQGNSPATHVQGSAATGCLRSSGVARPSGYEQGLRSKVSLARYRRASVKIFQVLKRCAAAIGATFQRASIDEAYVDMTSHCARLCEVHSKFDEFEAFHRGRPELLQHRSIATAMAATNVVGVDSLDTSSPADQLLASSVVEVRRMRQAIFDELHYTISAGISHNRLLAKIASSRYKPNQQTIIPACAAKCIMAEQAINRVPGLGGKFGAEVLGIVYQWEQIHGVKSRQPNDANAGSGGGAKVQPVAPKSWERPKTGSAGAKVIMAQLQAIPIDFLIQKLGDSRAQWLHGLARGVDMEAVETRADVKSLQAFKSFRAIIDPAHLTRWLTVLAGELLERMQDDRDDLQRFPTHLVVYHRLSGNYKTDGSRRHRTGAEKRAHANRGKTKVVAMPGATSQKLPTLQALVAAAQAAVNTFGDRGTPCTRIGLSAVDFKPLPSADAGIKQFFTQKASQMTPPTTSNMKKPTSTVTSLDLVSVDAASTDDATGNHGATNAGPAKKQRSLRFSASKGARSGTSKLASDMKPGETSCVSSNTCSKCGRRFSAMVDLNEHLDFHLAQELQAKEDRGNEIARRFDAAAKQGRASTKKKVTLRELWGRRVSR